MEYQTVVFNISGAVAFSTNDAFDSIVIDSVRLDMFRRFFLFLFVSLLGVKRSSVVFVLSVVD